MTTSGILHIAGHTFRFSHEPMGDGFDAPKRMAWFARDDDDWIVIGVRTRREMEAALRDHMSAQ